jgi:hypothetical protein
MASEIESREQVMWAGMEPEAVLSRPLPVQPEAKGQPRLQRMDGQQMVWRTVDVRRLIGGITRREPFGTRCLLTKPTLL